MDSFNPPRVIARPSVIDLGGRTRITDFFTVVDPDENSSIVRYQVRDNGVGGGNLLIGEAVIPENVWREVTAGQINSVNYRAAPGLATETFSVRAQDSAGNWSNVGTSTITSGNRSPTIGVSNGRVAPFETISIVDRINYFDPDGDDPVLVGILDRRINSDGGRLQQEGIDLQQGRWHFFSYEEAQTVLYRGADSGPDLEEISVIVKDQFSFSEEVTFELLTTARPELVDTGENVLVDEAIWAGRLFEFVDEDGDHAVAYNFIDRRINDDGGRFELNGEVLESGVWHSVSALEFNSLMYRGGSTGPQSEVVSFHVFAGGEWSEVTSRNVDTVTIPEVNATDVSVRRGHYLNVATGGVSNVSGAQAAGTPFLDFTDADGDIVEKVLIIDYQLNATGGNFVFNGVDLQSGVHHEFAVDELINLEYRAGEFGFQTENLSIYAFSNGEFSEREDFRIFTLRNEFAPEVNLINATGRLGVSTRLDSLFTWSDGDDDIPHTFSVFDTGQDPDSGFFTDNGVRVNSGEWVTFDWDKVGDLRWNFANVGSVENVRFRINDGRAQSNVATATFTSVAAPELEAPSNSVSIDTIERLDANTLISQTDAGPVFTRYEIYDENPGLRSGRFELDGVDLRQGGLITLTAAEFNRVVFKGGESDFGRILDPVLIRATNGATNAAGVPEFTEWERININTDPVGADSLTSGQFWVDGNPDTTTITYTFIDGDNNNLSGPHPPVPTYYRCVPMDNPDEECNNAGEAFGLNAVQREAVRTVLANYASFTNLIFEEVAFTADAGNAVFTFGASDFPAGIAGLAYLPGGAATDVRLGQGARPGDIWFDTDFFHPNTNFDAGAGTGFTFTALHEVGHALGNKHPFALPNALPIASDFDYNTVMSNTHGSVHDPLFPDANGYFEQPSSAQLYDLVELQRIYGVNTTHNSNNTHYGNLFSGSAPHFFDNGETHQTTLYDAGGIDTYNYSNHTAAETIDLRQGTWSSINGIDFSLRTAYLTVIENARGGSNNDNIRGNEINNLLFGNAGDDILRGGGANDVLRGGTGSDTYVWSTGDGRDTVREESNGGVDVLMVLDPSGAVDALQNDLSFRRFGNDLRIDLTYNQGEGQGTVNIVNFADSESQVEILRIHDAQGNQIGGDISLVSAFEQATTVAQQFSVTGTERDFGGVYSAFTVAPA